MITQLYVLGFLIRWGPQHGYLLKQRLTDYVADFTQIKQSAIYYHLEKLEQAGHVTSETESEGARPDRNVYTVTESGRQEFKEMLWQALQPEYEPQFTLDAAVYFQEYLPGDEIVSGLKDYARTYDRMHAEAVRHMDEVIDHIPADRRFMATSLFRHHLVHLEAEAAWARETAESMASEQMAAQAAADVDQ